MATYLFLKRICDIQVISTFFSITLPIQGVKMSVNFRSQLVSGRMGSSILFLAPFLEPRKKMFDDEYRKVYFLGHEPCVGLLHLGLFESSWWPLILSGMRMKPRKTPFRLDSGATQTAQHPLRVWVALVTQKQTRWFHFPSSTELALPTGTEELSSPVTVFTYVS